MPTAVAEKDMIYSTIKKIATNKSLHINKFYKTKKEIIIKCNSAQENEEVIKMIQNIDNLKIDVGLQSLKKPRICVTGIDHDISTIEDEDFIEDIKLRNSSVVE